MKITKETSFIVVDAFDAMCKLTINQLQVLGANGSNIQSASNGAAALKLLQEQVVDLVISCWNMPVMDGLELLRAMRSDKNFCRIPFLMITAEAERHKIQEVIANGVTSLLVKPYTFAGLDTHVRSALFSKSRLATTPSSKLAVDAASDVTVHIPTMAKKPDKPVILVVDHMPDNLRLLADLFKDEYQVRIAHNGEKALAICQSDNPPDLVLLDVMMPGMDGFEVATKMREHHTSEHIPVIFVTEIDTTDIKLKGLELGAVDFVTKPIDLHMLKPRVRNFLRYVDLHKHLQADYDSMLETARLKEDVENIIRHDMKDPLAGIIGLVQTLAGDDMMDRQQIKQLHMIEEIALQVLNMINLSSELYKIETGRFKLDAKPVKIGDILRRIAEILRTTFKGKNLNISVDTDIVSVSKEIPQILGDAMLCYSLFQDLIKNACEAAPENSRVVVIMEDMSPMRITIQNKGAVPKEIREHFFDKFVTHGKSSGTGIGAYSAKLLTEVQHGKIELQVSDEENLTTVTVNLPRFYDPNVLQ